MATKKAPTKRVPVRKGALLTISLTSEAERLRFAAIAEADHTNVSSLVRQQVHRRGEELKVPPTSAFVGAVAAPVEATPAPDAPKPRTKRRTK